MSVRSIRSGARTVVLAGVLGACLMACSEAATTDDAAPSASATAESVAADSVAADGAEPSVTPSASASGVTEADRNSPELVRDAFAGLQATLDDTCTVGAGDCAYFLGRVNEELTGLQASMKADAQGPGHFKEPLAWMSTLGGTLNGDISTENLEKHRTELIGIRDRINTWMQGHPEDYR